MPTRAPVSVGKRPAELSIIHEFGRIELKLDVGEP
jgi:hypothetical protein